MQRFTYAAFGALMLLVMGSTLDSGYGLIEHSGAYDLNGERLIIDEDADSYIDDLGSDDRIGFTVGGANQAYFQSGNLVFINGGILMGSSLRAIASSAGALELGGNHTPTASLGTNDASVEDGIGANFFLPRGFAADPCTGAGASTVPDGGVFLNSSADAMCRCTASGVDVLLSDNTTACY